MVSFTVDYSQATPLISALYPLLFLTTLNYNWPTDYLTSYDSYQWWPPKILTKCDIVGNGTLGISFDYIVVGSGAAGSVIANRLALNSSRTVLLIEAGDAPLIQSIPPRFFPLNLNTSGMYNYNAESSPNYGNAYKNGAGCGSGKSIGGSTQTNAMLYECGTDDNYNQWAQIAGDTSWNYANILKYFKRSHSNNEANLSPTCSSFYGTSGPLKISKIGDDGEDFMSYLRSAVSQSGYTEYSDFNCAPSYNGFFNIRMTISDGQRMSAAKAFLMPLNSKSNFYYMNNARVDKVLATKNLITGDVYVTGVNVLTSNTACASFIITAKREIILSAGTYGTPQILQRSGFGKSDDLAACNFQQLKDIPVGRNLADHVAITSFYTINNIYNATWPNELAYRANLFFYGLQYGSTYNNPYFTRFSSINYQGFINVTDNNAKYPDVQFYIGVLEKNLEDLDNIININFGFIPAIADKIITATNNNPIVQVLTVGLNPKSRGSVKIRSCTDSYAKPIINANYFSDASDIDTVLKGLTAMCAFFNTAAMQGINATPLKVVTNCNNFTYCSDDYNRCYIKYMSSSVWQATGTSSMGTLPSDSVVDSKLKVFGVQKTILSAMLRVADESIIPVIPSSDIQCSSYAIGEKAADLIITENL